MASACDPVRAAIAAYRDGESSPERSAEAAAHLRECPECRTLLQEVVGTADERLVVRALEARAPRGGIAEGVVQRIRAGDPGSQAPAPAVEDEDEYEAMARYGGSGPRGRSGMGMMIEYCLKCRERIDPADFRNGTALQWKGQSFCGNCKAEILPKLEKDPAFIAAQKAAARPGSGRHESASDRAGTGRRPRSEIFAPQGPNVKLIVGVGGGVAAVALIGAIAMTMGGGGTSTPTPVVKPPVTAATARGSGKVGVGKVPVAPVVPDGPAQLSPAAEAKLLGVTERLTSRLSAVRKYASENEMEFQEIDLKYKTFLDEDEWKDADVKKYEKLQKLRTDVVSEMERHQQRLQALVNDEVNKAISRAMAFADRGEFGTAYRQLDTVPRYLMAASEEARKRIAAARDDIERKEKSRFGDFVMGQWNVLYDGKADARWSISGAGASVTQDDAEKAMVVTGPTQGNGLLVFNAPDRERWADYEIEMTVQPQEGTAIGLRLGRDPNRPTQLNGEIVRFDANDAKGFKIYLMKLEGQRFVVEQDGKSVLDRPTDFLRGPPMFAIPPGKVIKIKAFKIRVTKALG